MFCIKCGRKLADDFLFCPKCGTKVLEADKKDEDSGLDDDDLDLSLDDDSDDEEDNEDSNPDFDDEIEFKEFDWTDNESVEYFTICLKEARGEYLTTSEFMKQYSSLVILGRNQLMRIYEERINHKNWLEYQEEWDSTNGIVDEIADYEKFRRLPSDMRTGPVKLISRALHLISKINDNFDDDEIKEMKSEAAECSYEAAATGNIMGLALAAYCALKRIGVPYNPFIAEHCADIINISSFRKNHPDILMKDLIEEHCSGLSNAEIFDLAEASHSYVWLEESKLEFL